MSIINKLFKRKIDELSENLTNAEQHINSLEERFKKLRDGSKIELLKEEIQRLLSDYSCNSYSRGLNCYFGVNSIEETKKDSLIKEKIDEHINELAQLAELHEKMKDSLPTEKDYKRGCHDKL